MKLPERAIATVVAPAPGTMRGMLFMLAAAMFLAFMMAGARYASAEMHPYVIVFFRLALGFLLVCPSIVLYRLGPLKTRRLPLVALRSVICGVSILLIFTGLSMTVLAKATALQFSAPLFAAVLAPFFLGEVVRARRIAALIVGYIGTLVILRPGFVAVDLGSLLVLSGAATWGLGMIQTKVLSRTESSLTITAYMTLFSAPLAFLVALPVWTTPSWEHVTWMLAIAGFGTAGDLCMAQAFKSAEATAVIPFDFTKLVWVAIIGYFAFDEIPDAGTWVGGLMVLAAVTYIAHREHKSRAAASSQVGPP